MEVAGTILAIPGVLDLCLKYGKYMYERYQTFQKANEKYRVQVLAIESRWLQIEAQIKFLNSIWDRLPPRLQIHFNHVLSWLHTLLIKATALVDGLVKSSTSTTAARPGVSSIMTAISKEGSLRRGVFALSRKDTLDELIGELRTWHQDMLGPSWLQLLRLPNAIIFDDHHGVTKANEVAQLRQLHEKVDIADQADFSQAEGVILPYNFIQPTRKPIFATDITVGVQRSTGASVLIEEVVLPKYVDRTGTLMNFYKLATKLQAIDPSTTNLPKCGGLVDMTMTNPTGADVALVFHLPRGLSSPRSLRELLMESDPFFALHDRISIAVQIAKAVMTIHSLRIVHKGIRPETILLFHQLSAPTHPCVEEVSALGNKILALVLGFEQFRPVDMRSYLRSDMDWRKALYRHPSRHGHYPEVQYSMQHDIYSLGICLLEIGLWKSFVLSPGGPGTPHPDVDSSRLPGREQERKALMIKERLQQIASAELPAKMGRKYCDVVLSCLGCLDRDNEGFGRQEDLEDDDEILVSIRFMEVVLLELQSIVV